MRGRRYGDPGFLSLKFPVNQGESFVGGVYYFEPQGYREDSVIVMATNETVTVPRGTFSCVHYMSFSGRPSERRLESNRWYCPGVGLVKSQAYARTSKGVDYIEFRGELIAYTIL